MYVILMVSLTTMVESCRKAKPLFRCVCLSLIRRMLDGESVANGAKADRMASTDVCGPRFLRIRAGGGEGGRGDIHDKLIQLPKQVQRKPHQKDAKNVL